MKNTIVGVAGRRLVVKFNALENGMLLLVICDRHGEPMGCIKLDIHTAMAAASAIELTAKYVEKYQAKKPVDIGTDWQHVNEVARGIG